MDFSDSEWKTTKHKMRRFLLLGLWARRFVVYLSTVRLLGTLGSPETMEQVHRGVQFSRS